MMNKQQLYRQVLTLAFIGSMTASAFAYTTTDSTHKRWRDMNSDERVSRTVEIMKKRLAITDDQAIKIASVLHDEQQTIIADRDKVKNASSENKGFARAQLQQDLLDAKVKVMKQLKPDQLAKAEELRKRWAHKNNLRKLFRGIPEQEGSNDK